MKTTRKRLSYRYTVIVLKEIAGDTSLLTSSPSANFARPLPHEVFSQVVDGDPTNDIANLLNRQPAKDRSLPVKESKK